MRRLFAAMAALAKDDIALAKEDVRMSDSPLPEARFYRPSSAIRFNQEAEQLSRFAAKELVFLFTPAVGATQAAKQKNADADGDYHRQKSPNRE